MLNAVLIHIKENILTLNPNTFQRGYSGARQYQDGKIVTYDTSEGTYVGLKDNDYNYFYIRYLTDFPIDIAPDDNRFTSCNELEGSPTFRLVACVRNGDFGKLIEVLLNDIVNTDFTTMTTANRERFSDIQIFFSDIQPDPEQIFKDEVGTDENADVRLAKNVTLAAIDFGIRFTYKLKTNDCLDRDICVGCS